MNKSSMYKIAFVDIDGTILPGGKKRLSDYTVEVMRHVESKGIPVCINTGRNIAHSEPVVRQTGLKSPVSVIDGLCVYNPLDMEIIYNNPLSKSDAVNITNLAKERGMFIELVTHFMYCRHVNGLNYLDYNAGQDDSTLRYIENFDELLEKSAECTQIILGGETAVLNPVCSEIAENINGCLMQRNFLWEKFSFISAANTGKAVGMKVICDYFGIPLSEAVAIGDQSNDLDMLRAAGMPVVMGNAPGFVKEAGAYITDTAENDGAAKALLKFFG